MHSSVFQRLRTMDVSSQVNIEGDFLDATVWIVIAQCRLRLYVDIYCAPHTRTLIPLIHFREKGGSTHAHNHSEPRSPHHVPVQHPQDLLVLRQPAQEAGPNAVAASLQSGK